MSQKNDVSQLKEGSTGLENPDWILFVQTGRVDGRRTLHYSLTTRERQLEDLGSVTLKADLGNFFESFFKEIGEIDPAVDSESRIDILSSMGVQLAVSILPEKLRRRFQELRGRAATGQIMSDESSIPWELVRIRDGAEGADGDFYLCEAFALTRWRRGVDHRTRLPLWNPALVVVESAGLDAIGDEAKEIESAFRDVEREVHSVPATYREITEAMSSGSFGAWHFVGHGAAWDGDPDQWSIPLDDGTPLTPRRLHGKARGVGKSRPLIFLNCCHSAKGGQSLTKIGGWAEQYLDLGAAAFIGASWETSDRAAKEFARVFYREFLGGTPIGEAVRQARSTVRASFSGDATWLAFTVFAHPCAVFSTEEEPERPRVVLPEIKDAGKSFGGIDAGAKRSGSPTARRKVVPLPGKRRGRLFAAGALALVVLIGIVLLVGSKDENGPLESSESSVRTLPSSPPPSSPPPPPPPIEMAAIEAGKVGVAALDKGTLAWNDDVSRILYRHLREQRPDLDVALAPEALRARLGSFRDGDFSALPGGESSPYGFEHVLLMIVGQTPMNGRFTTFSVTCETTLVSTKEREILLEKMFDNTGMGTNESSALDQAFGRCIDESQSAIP